MQRTIATLILSIAGAASIKQAAPPPPEGGITKRSDHLEAADKWKGEFPLGELKDIRKIARAITLAEAGEDYNHIVEQLLASSLISSIPPSGGGGAYCPRHHRHRRRR